MEMKSAASLRVIGPCLLLLLLAALCQAASPSHSDNRIPNPHPLITTTTTTSPTTATTATTRSSSSLAEAVKRPRRRGGRRCKCLKRMRQEVNELIADRLEDFETRYLRPLQRNHAQTLAPERTLLKGHLQTMDRRLQKVSGEVFLMKESLTTMEQQLRVVRQDLRTTGGDVQSLNESWHRLDGAVKDLGRFVSAVENVVLPAVSSPEQCPTGGCQATDPPLPQTYPRNQDPHIPYKLRPQSYYYDYSQAAVRTLGNGPFPAATLPEVVVTSRTKECFL